MTQTTPPTHAVDRTTRSRRPFRVFFGHQSVGADIVRGLGELPGSERTPALRICDRHHIESEQRRQPDGSWLLVHSIIGRNRDPLSKLDEFDSLVRGELAGVVDVALFKFCYVDVTAATPVDELFRAYMSRMQTGVVAGERARIAHITIPLRAVRRGWRARISRALGRTDPEIEDNRAREDFNRRLRDAFAATELFDLAAVESDRPRAGLSGDSARSLRADCTNDGGHLNARGRRIAALAFLQFLESLRSSTCPQR